MPGMARSCSRVSGGIIGTTIIPTTGQLISPILRPACASSGSTRSGDWSVWLKKQTGVDGFRLDAAKHFESWATQDFLWNLAYNAGFASGGSQMFAVGEYIGSAAEMDSWVDAVNASNGGGFDLVGTFVFSLRGALKSMIGSSGSFDLGSLPDAQQMRRSRSVSFVNNHDTFRPTLRAAGNY